MFQLRSPKLKDDYSDSFSRKNVGILLKLDISTYIQFNLVQPVKNVEFYTLDYMEYNSFPVLLNYTCKMNTENLQ